MSNSEYVLVPREPTLEMQRAGLDALDGGALGLCDCCHNDVWAAMIAAAPAQPSSWYRIDDPVNPAPKDGTYILLTYRDAASQDPPPVISAYWSELSEKWLSPISDSYLRPTHWKPLDLPPPPDEGG